MRRIAEKKEHHESNERGDAASGRSIRNAFRRKANRRDRAGTKGNDVQRAGIAGRTGVKFRGGKRRALRKKGRGGDRERRRRKRGRGEVTGTGMTVWSMVTANYTIVGRLTMAGGPGAASKQTE